MGKIEKTKAKIGVSGIDREQRKELFDKFVDAGGKVINEKKKKNLVIDRERQKKFQKKVQEKRTNQRNKRSRIVQEKTVSKKKNIKKTRSVKKGTYLERLKIRFRLRVLKVAQLNGLFFISKFYSHFSNDFTQAIINIQMIYFDIFKKDPERGDLILKRLDKAQPLFFDVINLSGNIYDKVLFERINGYFSNYSTTLIKIIDLRDPLLQIYRKLHILKPFENTILDSFENALKLNATFEKTKSSVLSSKRKIIRNDLYIIFEKLYPRLHWLFCSYNNRIYDFCSPNIDRILSVTNEQKPGNRKVRKTGENISSMKTANKTEEEEENKVEENEIEEKVKVPDAVKNGLNMIYQLDIKEMRKKFDRARALEHLKDVDKILITYLLFREFDKEYSCILTTNKIKYNVDYSREGKLDYKQKLHDLYDEMRKMVSFFKNYMEITVVYNKAYKDKPSSKDQYIQYSKRLQDIQNKRKEIGGKTRINVRSFMEKVSREVTILIDDLDTDEKYVSNPQDEIRFDSNIEGDKKINGKKVYEALRIFNYFTSGFAYRLSPDGDLSGDLEFKDNEKDDKDKIDLKTLDDSVAEFSAEEKITREEKPGKSILEELDDLL